MRGHTKTDHEALKLDEARWAELEPAGVQEVPALGDEPEERYELRTCSCHSTLARVIA